MSKRATHIIDAIGHQYTMTLVDRKARVLCGKPLYYPHPDHHGAKAREHTVSIANASVPLKRPRNSPDPKRCKECWRLAMMDLTDRNAALAIREENKRLALLKLQDKGKQKRDEERTRRLQHIEAMRVEALACRDAFIDNGREIRTLDEVLEAAIDLYKLNNKSSGDRLVVLVPGSRECRRCGAVTDAEDTCPECVASLPDRKRKSKAHVACRFCRAILGRNQDPFKDYSHATFDPNGNTCFAHDNHPGAIDVRKHTVNCAFEYLLGEQTIETNQDDAPLVIPGALPSESFVLELDP